MLAHTSQEALARAGIRYQTAQQRAQDGQNARAEYAAHAHAVEEKTARLRMLRLAREAEPAVRSPAKVDGKRLRPAPPASTVPAPAKAKARRRP